MSDIVVQTTIHRCTDCCHLEHSGAFTPGGSKPVCSHSKAIFCFTKDLDATEPTHWKHRVIRITKSPPANCPLRNGFSY